MTESRGLFARASGSITTWWPLPAASASIRCAWWAAPWVRSGRRNSLEVIIEDWCIGCGLCAENCPYGNINLHPFNVMADDPEHPGRQKAAVKQKATSCDLCTDHAEPSCVYACPHDAAHRVDPRKFFANLLAQTTGQNPES